jgi:multidrug efflux pump subunit AcrB
VKNELLVNLLLVLITILGLVALSNMNSSFFPNVKEKFIIIEAVYPGASPREVEEGIVLKIEENLKSVSGIDRITSTSKENNASITIELFSNQNADIVLLDVKNAVDQISNFPEGMERLVTYVRENENFTAKIAIRGDVSLSVLKDRAEAFEDGLRAFENISKVQLSGFSQEEIEVAVDENQLRAYNLTFQEIANAISSENLQTTGGRIKDRIEVIIRADQKEYTAKQLGNLVVRSSEDGNVVRLSDVAEIREDWAETTDLAYFNGKQSVLVTVNTLNEENILEAAEDVLEYIETFNLQNRGVEAVLVQDGTVNLKERISLLTKNGILGAFLVMFLLGMFLRIRLAFWVAAGIPISFLGMFILLSYFGITINVLSLFGMILVIGILVDDGIVIGENIFQHYESGKPKFKAVIEGTMEVMPSVLSALTTTCVAFSFFFFIEGRLGEFFSDVAAVVICALGFSIFEVFLFLPAHLAHVKDLNENMKPNKVKLKIENSLLKFRDKIFVPMIEFCLRQKFFAFMVAVSILIVTFGSIGKGIIRSTFFPNIEQTSVQVSLEYPSGTSESITAEAMNKIEAAAARLNQEYIEKYDTSIIKDMEIRLGPGSNIGSATFYLIASESREIRSFEVATDLRRIVGPIPGTQKLSFESATPFGKPLNVSFSGENFDRLRAAVADFKYEVSETGLVKDLVTNDQADQAEVNLSLTETGRALGFSLREVVSQVRSGFFGFEAQRLQRGDDEVKVWVRYQMEDRDRLQDLENMRILAPSGEKVPLNMIANIKPVNGLLAINHLDGKRQINLQGELANFDISSTEMISKVSADIIPVIRKRYPDVKVEFDGQQRDTAKLGRSVKQAGPIILLLIFSMMVITFRSVSQAVSLMLIIPFGIVGAAWGHFIHDAPMSVLSFLGFIALVGVIINDGLVYVAAFNNYLQEGKKFDEALKATSISRFRPIFLTTVTTTAGLGPLIFEKSFQAQFLIPMAITVAYGLLLGSLLLMLLLPVTLAATNRIKVMLKWLWEGERPTKEEVEKAVQRLKKEVEYEGL